MNTSRTVSGNANPRPAAVHPYEMAARRANGAAQIDLMAQRARSGPIAPVPDPIRLQRELGQLRVTVHDLTAYVHEDARATIVQALQRIDALEETLYAHVFECASQGDDLTRRLASIEATIAEREAA